jgi:hypothetical protein
MYESVVPALIPHVLVINIIVWINVFLELCGLLCSGGEENVYTSVPDIVATKDILIVIVACS